MSPVRFARAMRTRGWRSQRLARGKVAFGTAFPIGGGITRVFATQALMDSRLDPASLADFVTRDAVATCARIRGAVPA